jgi:hypothetical protein
MLQTSKFGKTKYGLEAHSSPMVGPEGTIHITTIRIAPNLGVVKSSCPGAAMWVWGGISSKRYFYSINWLFNCLAISYFPNFV